TPSGIPLRCPDFGGVTIMLLNERRLIIETLKYSDEHKKLLDGVLFDKLKLDAEFELEEEIIGEQLIKEYKAIKEKEDPGAFVLPICLEGKEKVKPISDKVRMLDHSDAETMGRLLDVLCQVGVTTILANFMLLDIPVDRDVPIIVGRSFLYTCRAIMNTIKKKMTTFDGHVHQQFNMAKVRNVHEESDSDDEE
ncbi:hypothetical protein Tco_1356994, partial [Tanacetum coccineum]